MSEQPPNHRPDLRELLQSERERPEPPPEAKERVRQSMRHSLSEDDEVPRGELRLAPKAAGSFMGWLLAHAPLALAGLGATGFFVLGVYLGFHPDGLQPLVGQWGRRPAAHAAAAPATNAVTPATQTPRRVSQGIGGGRAAAPQDSSLEATHAAESLEGRLLDQARRALKGGQSSDALKSLAEAEQVEQVLEQGSYVGQGLGTLAEEREALTVVALARVGNQVDAKRQMAKFAARYPQSFYLAQLQDELKSSERGAAR